jgi:hypothetical protein
MAFFEHAYNEESYTPLAPMSIYRGHKFIATDKPTRNVIYIVGLWVTSYSVKYSTH